MMSPKKFLFIDDDADDRDFFCSTIHSIDSSIECYFAKDGFDGVQQLKNDVTFIPDFIFIDMNMPRMDGRECLHEIRKIQRLDSSKVYMYSTVFNPKVEQELVAAGADGILVKPSNITELNNLLQTVVRSA